MKNKFITIIIAFTTVFFSQSQVWASSENLKVQTEFSNIQIDKSTFLVVDDSPSIIARRDLRRFEDQSGNWIASIFIAGLGQIMMGDTWRGVKFMLLSYGIASVTTIITIIGGAMIYMQYVIIFLIISAIFYLWNIFDAYSMSKEQAGMSKLNDEKIARLEKDLKTAMELANSIKVSDSGAVSVRALAF